MTFKLTNVRLTFLKSLTIYQQKYRIKKQWKYKYHTNSNEKFLWKPYSKGQPCGELEELHCWISKIAELLIFRPVTTITALPAVPLNSTTWGVASKTSLFLNFNTTSDWRGLLQKIRFALESYSRYQSLPTVPTAKAICLSITWCQKLTCHHM